MNSKPLQKTHMMKWLPWSEALHCFSIRLKGSRKWVIISQEAERARSSFCGVFLPLPSIPLLYVFLYYTGNVSCLVTVCLCHFKCVTQSVLKFPELRRSLSVQYFMQQTTTAGLEYLEFSIKDNCSGNPNSMKFRIRLLLSHVAGAICNCIFDWFTSHNSSFRLFRAF